jgi:putative FmdB family regulatory protein
VPLYEFECQKCHHRFEKIQSFAAGDPQCPKCGGAVERLLHAAAVQFKGSGWYATDYAKSRATEKSESKSGDKSDSSTPATTESKSESKTETKRESKTESKSTGSKEEK